MLGHTRHLREGPPIFDWTLRNDRDQQRRNCVLLSSTFRISQRIRRELDLSGHGRLMTWGTS